MVLNHPCTDRVVVPDAKIQGSLSIFISRIDIDFARFDDIIKNRVILYLCCGTRCIMEKILAKGIEDLHVRAVQTESFN